MHAVIILSKLFCMHGTINARSVKLVLVCVLSCLALDGHLYLSAADPYLFVLKSKAQIVRDEMEDSAMSGPDMTQASIIDRGGIAVVQNHFWVFVSIQTSMNSSLSLWPLSRVHSSDFAI